MSLQKRLTHPDSGTLTHLPADRQAGPAEHDDRGSVLEVTQFRAPGKGSLSGMPAYPPVAPVRLYIDEVQPDPRHEDRRNRNECQPATARETRADNRPLVAAVETLDAAEGNRRKGQPRHRDRYVRR